MATVDVEDQAIAEEHIWLAIKRLEQRVKELEGKAAQPGEGGQPMTQAQRDNAPPSEGPRRGLGKAGLGF